MYVDLLAAAAVRRQIVYDGAGNPPTKNFTSRQDLFKLIQLRIGKLNTNSSTCRYIKYAIFMYTDYRMIAYTVIPQYHYVRIMHPIVWHHRLRRKNQAAEVSIKFGGWRRILFDGFPAGGVIQLGGGVWPRMKGLLSRRKSHGSFVELNMEMVYVYHTSAPIS